MVWWLFPKKRDLHRLHEEVKSSFEAVKNDFQKVSDWISHLHSRGEDHESVLTNLNGRLSTIENDLEEIKSFISFFGARMSRGLSKHLQTGVGKQTAVGVVQTPVQTAVQTAFMSNLSMMERTVLWVLINTDMKLSCEDVAALLGKEKSTIRGQINAIKQKNEGLIEEVIESSGKKRFFIEPKMKDMLLKKIQVSRKKAKTRK